MVTRTVRLRASSASRMALSRSLSCALSCTAMPTAVTDYDLLRASLCEVIHSLTQSADQVCCSTQSWQPSSLPCLGISSACVILAATWSWASPEH
jgi:hypothetical protein